MTGRFASWMFAAAFGLVSIGCQPAEEPQPDTGTEIEVDLGEAAPADSNTTTSAVETPEVTETPVVVEEEPADE